MNVRTKGVAWFLGISFGLAWISWEVAIYSGVPVASLQFQLFALPGAFAPAIAAAIVRKWITREGFADAGLGLHLRRWYYYLFAWLLPLVIVAAIASEAAILGIAKPDFTYARAIASASHAAGPAATAIAASGHLVLPQLILAALLTTPLLFGEEFGWRSYLQPRLFTGRPIAAAIATGAIWGVWHFPLTLRGYDYPDHPVLGSILLVIIAILLAYIFGWILQRSGSIWASSLAHAATNAIGGMLTALWFTGAAAPAIVGYAGGLAIPPLLIVCGTIHYFSSRNPSRRVAEVRVE